MVANGCSCRPTQPFGTVSLLVSQDVLNDWFWPIAAFREGLLVVNRSRAINQDQAQSGRSRREDWPFAVLRANPIGPRGRTTFSGITK